MRKGKKFSNLYRLAIQTFVPAILSSHSSKKQKHLATVKLITGLRRLKGKEKLLYRNTRNYLK